MLRKWFYRTLGIILLLLTIFIVSNQFTPVQKLTARCTASIYVAFHYSNLNLQYQGVEYAYGFGNYNVSYRDLDGNIYNFMVSPKFLPIWISFDSISKHS